jgi:hypothetical protein
MKMRPVALLPAALLSAALLSTSCGRETPPPPTPPETPVTPPAIAGIKPVDIPAGYGYPGDRSEFQLWADEWKIEEITTAAWNLWAGMTSDSGQTWSGNPLPVWETWCGTEEVFGSGCGSLARPPRDFDRPSQFSHGAPQVAAQSPANTQVVSFNKFNPPMADYFGTPHPGPGGASYRYTSMQDLANLNAAWPAGTQIDAREVVGAPYQPDRGDTIGFTGIETKPMMMLVKATGLTPVPVWMGSANSKTPTSPDPSTWQVCVLVDPGPNAPTDPSTPPTPATPEQIAQIGSNLTSALSCDPSKYLYAPLAAIYAFRLDADEAADWNAIDGPSQNPIDGAQGLDAAAGDYAVLVGMHVTTKATVNWIWQTFWWQPGENAPEKFPGSKDGMTDNVAGAWRNYAMCTAWNQTKGNASREMGICFNPYLETFSFIPSGLTSNCMSCHGTATFGSPLVAGSPPTLPRLNYPADYKQPIDLDNDPRFATFTRTDFSWAMQANAVPPPAAPTGK